mmetsp:Transcript_11305/g.24175  ORF Transcript_11305/g.24175 Transcript_11305/m.24175 type:complete len:204 (-) Transcript_11305:1633-2244(-)
MFDDFVVAVRVDHRRQDAEEAEAAWEGRGELGRLREGRRLVGLVGGGEGVDGREERGSELRARLAAAAHARGQLGAKAARELGELPRGIDGGIVGPERGVDHEAAVVDDRVVVEGAEERAIDVRHVAAEKHARALQHVAVRAVETDSTEQARSVRLDAAQLVILQQRDAKRFHLRVNGCQDLRIAKGVGWPSLPSRRRNEEQL